MNDSLPPETLEAGAALDDAIAIELFGWRKNEHWEGKWTPPGKEPCHPGLSYIVSPPNYSRDLASAWLVVERMQADGWGWVISGTTAPLQMRESYPTDPTFHVCFGGQLWADAPTVPLAICRAALASLAWKRGSGEGES